MRTESVMYFTEKEEEFAHVLVSIGTRKNVASVLVFLANTSEATSLAIERGTDLRQPEVSLALKFMADHGWIEARESKSERMGRPMKIYKLAKPITAILKSIEKEKKAEADAQIERVKKLREYIS